MEESRRFEFSSAPRRFLVMLGTPNEEYRRFFKPLLKDLEDQVNNGDLTSISDFFNEDLQDGMYKEAQDAGITFGDRTPDEEDDEGAWDYWRSIFDKKWNQFMGALSTMLFPDSNSW